MHWTQLLDVEFGYIPAGQMHELPDKIKEAAMLQLVQVVEELEHVMQGQAQATQLGLMKK